MFALASLPLCQNHVNQSLCRLEMCEAECGLAECRES